MISIRKINTATIIIIIINSIIIIMMISTISIASSSIFPVVFAVIAVVDVAPRYDGHLSKQPSGGVELAYAAD